MDSRLEVLAGIAADLDPDVVKIKAQPFTIDVTTGQFFHSKAKLDEYRKEMTARGLKGVYYTPDILIKTKDQPTLVLEIKDMDWMSFSDEYEAKLAAATQIMKNRGISFQILANKFDETFPYVQNLKLLHAINHQIHKNDLSPTLLSFKEQEEKLRKLSESMYESGEMLSIQTLATEVGSGVSEICVAIIFGIFRAPIWTEQINSETLVAGTATDKPCFVRYQDFNLGV